MCVYACVCVCVCVAVVRDTSRLVVIDQLFDKQAPEIRDTRGTREEHTDNSWKMLRRTCTEHKARVAFVEHSGNTQKLGPFVEHDGNTRGAQYTGALEVEHKRNTRGTPGIAAFT